MSDLNDVTRLALGGLLLSAGATLALPWERTGFFEGAMRSNGHPPRHDAEPLRFTPEGFIFTRPTWDEIVAGAIYYDGADGRFDEDYHHIHLTGGRWEHIGWAELRRRHPVYGNTRYLHHADRTYTFTREAA